MNVEQTLRLNTDPAKKSIKSISSKKADVESAKSKVTGAAIKLASDDFLSLQSYKPQFYASLLRIEKELKNIINDMEQLTMAGNAAVTEFNEKDNGTKTTNNGTKKSKWSNIFDIKKIHSSGATWITGGLVGIGAAGVAISSIIGNESSKSTSSSITNVKKDWNNKDDIDAKGKAVDSYYEKLKDEHEKYMESLFGKGNVEKDTYNGQDCLIIKNAKNYQGDRWNQQKTDKTACTGYSMAVYTNITQKTDYDYNNPKYWTPDGCYYGKENETQVDILAEGHQNVLNEAFNRLNQGKPSVVRVDYDNDSYGYGHMVVVIGIKNSAIKKYNSGGTLDTSDFIIYDPYGGNEKELSSAGNHTGVTCYNLRGN